jgi:tetratricopeptide (TPR) repeat protein
MAKSPEQRFESVQDFAAVLKGAAPPPRPHAVAPLGPVARLRRAATAAVAIAGLAALGVFGWSMLSNAAPPAANGEIRLVVVPLEHTGPDASAYITDGVTEKLTNSLADIPGIAVIARTSAAEYAGKTKSPGEIARELNVHYVLMGALQRNLPGQAPGEVTLIAQLFREDALVAKYDPTIQESQLFASIPSIALNVAQTLDIDVSQPDRGRLAAQPTSNLEAWDYYLRGDEQYNRNWTRAVVDSAINLYDQATRLDPQFALAYAKLARAHAWMNQLRYDLSPERLEKSRRAAELALEIDSTLSEAHLGYGTYLYWGLDDYNGAVVEFSRARDLRPSGTSANQALVAMANVLRRLGRFDEAIANYRRAKELDPRSHIVWYNLGETLLFTHRYDSARVQLDQVTQLNRTFPEGYVQRARLALNAEGDVKEAHDVLLELAREVPDNLWRLPVWNMLRITDPSPAGLPDRMRPPGTAAESAAYHIVKANLFDGLDRRTDALAQFDSARAILERLARELETQPAIHAQLGLTYAARGRADDALREGRRAMALLPDSVDAFDGPEWRINLARIHAMLGNTDSAAILLRSAVEKPSWISTRFLAADPIWRRYAESPAFRSLLGEAQPRVADGR